MFIKLTSMAGNESYINFDKVFSITPKPYGSLLYRWTSGNLRLGKSCKTPDASAESAMVVEPRIP